MTSQSSATTKKPTGQLPTPTATMRATVAAAPSAIGPGSVVDSWAMAKKGSAAANGGNNGSQPPDPSPAAVVGASYRGAKVVEAPDQPRRETARLAAAAHSLQR